MEEVKIIFGHHSIWTWIGVLIVGFFIQLTFKLHKAPNKKSGFKWGYFWNDNALDFIKNTLLSFGLLRIGDEPIHELFSWVSEKIDWFPLKGEGMDIVVMVGLLSSLVSFLLHKFVKTPISKEIKKEMQVHNANCKHN